MKLEDKDSKMFNKMFNGRTKLLQLVNQTASKRSSPCLNSLSRLREHKHCLLEAR